MPNRKKRSTNGKANQAIGAAKRAAIASVTPRRSAPKGEARALGRGPSPGSDSVDLECGCDLGTEHGDESEPGVKRLPFAALVRRLIGEEDEDLEIALGDVLARTPEEIDAAWDALPMQDQTVLIIDEDGGLEANAVPVGIGEDITGPTGRGATYTGNSERTKRRKQAERREKSVAAHELSQNIAAMFSRNAGGDGAPSRPAWKDLDWSLVCQNSLDILSESRFQKFQAHGPVVVARVLVLRVFFQRCLAGIPKMQAYAEMTQVMSGVSPGPATERKMRTSRRIISDFLQNMDVLDSMIT